MIRIGIVGYGNVGRGAALAVGVNPDMELRAVFTRRDPGDINVHRADEPPLAGLSLAGLSPRPIILPIDSAADMVDEIDVMLLCGGSATDLPEQGPHFASMFNTVDSYDTHAKIPEYMASIDAVATNTTAIISTGWDPGLFSMMRSLFEATLPDGVSYTFWGKGFSQGHSDALRRIEGVKHAAQYTIPIESAVDAVRRGERPVFTPRQKMKRECFIVADDGTDVAEIKKTIVEMPHYFADYDTAVNFIDIDEFLANHSEMPHGGMVLHTGITGSITDGITVGSTGGNSQVMEFSLKLDSNPEFTGSIMAAYARAAYRMSKEGLFGAKTVFDVPLSYLAARDRETLIKELL